MIPHRIQLLLITVAVVALVGCDSGGVSLGTVSGTITKNGKPQAGMWIEFVPIQPGRLSYARTDSSGAYDLTYTHEKKGALVGKHRVSMGTGGEVGEGGNLLHPKVELHIEEVEVHSGANTQNFELAK